MSTLVRGEYKVKEFSRESDAHAAYWDFISGMIDDGTGDDKDRNGTDPELGFWGVSFREPK